ncbi:GldM family protein [Lewinella sp. 4G2]|uniref:GldM family protein n=1 Tax=Lewinella sp. 4G2 TaxID=1803372 RepID=UPI0007B4E477|nr:GldM family protein [Lewinella sp. 4G2]OAV43632.1 hypothetical protein A3850_003585 [Lewinella sp. 4G2]
MRTLLLLVLFLFSLPTFSQSPPAVISVDKVNRVLYAGVDNPLTIVAQQKEPVAWEQISAEITSVDGLQELPIKGYNGHFSVNPSSLGPVTITVTTATGKAKYPYNVRLVPVEVALGGFSSRNSTAPRTSVLGQIGIRAVVVNLDVCATAPVTTYEITTITNGTVRRHINQGGPFDATGRAMINDLQIGDTLIIRDVHVRRPGFDGALPVPDTLVLTIE